MEEVCSQELKDYRKEYLKEWSKEHPKYYRNYQEHTPEVLFAAREARKACLAKASRSISYRKSLEAFDGLMLGDGGLVYRGRSAKLHLGLSSKRLKIPSRDLIAYLNRVKGILEVLGVESMTGHPKVCRGYKKNGEPYEYCELWTKVSPFLTFEHVRWYCDLYPDGTAHKEVPEDFILTPISLAYWFMGDASSKYGNGPSVCLWLCSQGFNLSGVAFLEQELHRFGLNTGRAHSRAEKGSGIMISILQNSINLFMGIIDPYVIPPYRYKIKYRGSCPPELAEKYKEHHNEYMRESMREWRKRKEERALFSEQELFKAELEKVRLLIKRR